MSAKISTQAFVHEDAQVGDGVVIEPFAYIGPNVKMVTVLGWDLMPTLWIELP